MRVVEGVATVEDLGAFVDRLGEIGAAHGVVVQALDARYVVDRAHLETAVRLANRAVERGEAIADDRAVEILCYAAGRRQINRAMTMGVEPGESPVVVVVVDGGPGADGADEPSDGARSWHGVPPAEAAGGGATAAETAAAAAVADLLEPAATLGAFDDSLVREFFDVGEAELAAADGDLQGLVRERVALLVVDR